MLFGCYYNISLILNLCKVKLVFVMFYIIIISALILTTKTVFSEELALTNHSQLSDLILCRTCGNDISSSNLISFKSSPESQHTFNDTLFNRDGVIVQILMDFFFYVPVITVSQSGCKPVGEWTESESFPGYHWKVCVCPDCGANVGWVFNPSNPYREEIYKPFFGLILYSIIGEKCKYNNIFFLLLQGVCLFVGLLGLEVV